MRYRAVVEQLLSRVGDDAIDATFYTTLDAAKAVDDNWKTAGFIVHPGHSRIRWHAKQTHSQVRSVHPMEF